MGLNRPDRDNGGGGATSTATSGELAFERVYPINRDNEEEDSSQRQTRAEAREAAETGGSGRTNSQRQRDEAAEQEHDASNADVDMADANVETAHQVADDSSNNPAASNETTAAAQQQQQQRRQQESEAEAKAEPLKPGWHRKKQNKADWAEDDTTKSLTQYENDRAAQQGERMAGGTDKEIEDDVDMAPAEDASEWVDEDKEEAKRERKKADRRYLRERERKQSKAQQPPIHHNHRNERLGMVKFEPATFEEDAIQDKSERHALLSPLTEDEYETESGSSSEFECSDEDSSAEDSSSSSDDPFMSRLVDDRFDDRRARRKKEAKRKKQEKRRTKGRKDGRWDSEEQQSEEEEGEEEERGQKLDRPPRRRAAAPTNEGQAGALKERRSVPTAHKVAPPPTAREQNTIAFSSLTAEKPLLAGIAKQLRGFSLLPDEDDAADHVLVDGSKCTRTRKVLFGIARGSWIIDRRWLREYADADGQLVNVAADGLLDPVWDQEKYEVGCWPGAKRSRLLQTQGGRTPLVFDRHDKVFVAERTALDRRHVEQLLWLVGAQPVADYHSAQLCLCAADFTLQDLGSQLVGLSSGAFLHPIVTTEWLYDCISNGGRKGYDGYRRYTHSEQDEDGQLGAEKVGDSPAM